MELQVLTYPDPRLRERAAPVEEVTPLVREQVSEMFRMMYRDRGLGLAAPQVGIASRIIVVNETGDPERTDQEQVWINPEVLSATGSIVAEEGCLSFPGVLAQIRRAEAVEAVAWNLEWQRVPLKLTALGSRVLQHEFDHLDGILFLTRMSATDRLRNRQILRRLEGEAVRR